MVCTCIHVRYAHILRCSDVPYQMVWLSFSSGRPVSRKRSCLAIIELAVSWTVMTGKPVCVYVVSFHYSTIMTIAKYYLAHPRLHHSGNIHAGCLTYGVPQISTYAIGIKMLLQIRGNSAQKHILPDISQEHSQHLGRTISRLKYKK